MLARQAREAAKTSILFERRAALLEEALTALRNQEQKVASAETQSLDEAHRSEVRAQLIAQLLPLLDGLWDAMGAAARDPEDKSRVE